MSREIDVPAAAPDDDPDRPLFDRSGGSPAGSGARGRRVDVGGVVADGGAPAAQVTAPPAASTLTGRASRKARLSAGLRKNRGRARAVTKRPGAAAKTTKRGTTGSSLDGVLNGAVQTEPQSRLLLGAATGLTLLILNVAITALRNRADATSSADRLLLGQLILAVLLALGLLVTVVLTGWSAYRQRLTPSPWWWLGQYRRPTNQFLLSRPDGSQAEVRLLGKPSRLLYPGATLRLPNSFWHKAVRRISRGDLVKVGRIELLAGATGPVVGVITGKFPPAAWIARTVDRLGYLSVVLVLLLVLARLPFLASLS